MHSATVNELSLVPRPFMPGNKAKQSNHDLISKHAPTDMHVVL